MTSRRALTLCAMVVWAAVAVTAAPRALSLHHVLAARPASNEPAVQGCGDVHVRFDHHETVTESEERTFSKAEAGTLRVRAEANGGIEVQGSDQEVYSVTLCKTAEAGSEAQSVLSQVHLVFDHGELGVSGPSSSEPWSAQLIIHAPKGAALDLQVHNGPLTLEHVDGTLRVRAENGPVTVTGCTGQLDLSSRNGPVTLEENSGQQNVHSENGPLTVSLSGASWNGAGLEAHSTNGPVTLRVPEGFRSGVLLESEGSGPFRCSASVCSEGRKTWDDDRKRVEFGSGPTLVRVSTVNGPVSVD